MNRLLQTVSSAAMAAVLTMPPIVYPLTTAAVLPIVLGGCPAGSGTTDAQILADAAGVLSSLTAVVGEINTLKPGALPANVVGYLADAKQLIVNLTAATPAPAGASTLQTIDADINAVLSAVAPIAGSIYPAAGAIIAAIQVVLPGIEAWVNPLITQVTNVSAVAPPNPAALAAARKVLVIPVVK